MGKKSARLHLLGESMSDFFNRRPPTNLELYGFDGPRKEALERGDLIDVKQISWDAGFRWPLGVVSNVYDHCVRWTEEDDEHWDKSTQTEDERLWKLVNSAVRRIKHSGRHTDRMFFEVLCVNRKDGKFIEEHVSLSIFAVPDENGFPCLTICYPIKGVSWFENP